MDAATPSPAGAAVAPPPLPPTTTCAVTVAIHIRPLAPHEGAGPPAVVGLPPPTPSALPAASCGGQAFTVDAVYDGAAAAGADHRPELYSDHVAPLISGLFSGVNASVFAYGATGAGKTHTMGSAWSSSGNGASAASGIIPRAVADVFATVDAVRAAGAGPAGGAVAAVAVAVRASFVEILNEDLRDLLAPVGAASASSSSTVSIREVPGGGVCLAGAVEAAVNNAAELESLLSSAGARRATQATALNVASSRSHAIVTLTVDVKRGGGGSAPSFTTAKLQLVDLAGSERAKRTLAGGARLREAANINMGLLALGNVITALVQAQQGSGRRLSTGGGEPSNPTPPSSSSSHIPYRASKLTRLLSDALGGSARAVMVACVSPAAGDAGESRATLRWAARARAVRNMPVVQHGDDAAGLRAALGAARAEGEALRAALAAAVAEHQAAPDATPPPPPPPTLPPTPAPALRARISELEAALAAASAREAARASASLLRRASSRSRAAEAAEARESAAASARARLARLAGAAAVGTLLPPRPTPLPAAPGSAAEWVDAEAAVGAAAAELEAASAGAAARLKAAEAALDALPDAPSGEPGCEASREAAVCALEAAEAEAASLSVAAGAAASAAAAASARRRELLEGARPETLVSCLEAAIAALGRAVGGSAAAAAQAAVAAPLHPPSPTLTPGPTPRDAPPPAAAAPSPASAWKAQAEGATTRAAAIRERAATRAASRGGGGVPATTPRRGPLRSHPVQAVEDEEGGGGGGTRLLFGPLENQQTGGGGGAGTPLGGKLGALALEEEGIGFSSVI